MPTPIEQCRAEVDAELARLQQAIDAEKWTEEKAQKIADKAAARAVETITQNFYMSVGKRTVMVIGALVVGAVIWLHDLWLPKLK
jgi:hypothetical protein